MTGRLLPPPAGEFPASVDVAIVGAGAAGLVAALAAAEAGASAVLIERDPLPRGSTALSAGLIPAAGTRFQRAIGVEDDTPGLHAADIAAKSHGLADPALTRLVTDAAGPALEWLADRHGLPFDVVADFTYPGHARRRMHGLPSRSGAELVDRLRAAAEAAEIPMLLGAPATALFVADGAVTGVELADGRERIGCKALVLACNGYGGNRDLVRRHIPELGEALYFGHDGNRGDALLWGEALGVGLRHLSGHQGHGSVAHPHGILITWAAMTEGGIQVNAAGERFSDESQGYSEQAARVLAQPGGVAWNLFDARIAAICRQFRDFREAEAAGAIHVADDIPSLARRVGLPAAALEATLAASEAVRRGERSDPFDRDFAAVPPLAPPFHAAKVTGALFHTQGGLAVDAFACVLKPDGSVIPGLYAAGGAAVGVSGPEARGYLSGNGLLTAVALGRIAGTFSAVQR